MKNTTEQIWFGPLIGFIFGMAATHNVIAAAILAFLGLVIQGGILTARKNATLHNTSLLGEEADFVKVIIGLAAIVIKADGKIGERQLGFVEKKLMRDYSARRVQKLMSLLKDELKEEKEVEQFTNQIEEEFTDASKIQLMHFLIGLSILDGVLATGELNCLREISVKINLSLRTFDTILAMFKFRHEYEQRNTNPKKKTSSQLLDSAYKILGIDKTVTDVEVKKAYRKLAVAHHPDKVTHLGEEFLKAANEKFQIIVSAYDLIQKDRKFV